MEHWKEQPYRGKPIKHFPKRRKQSRNLVAEQRRDIFTVIFLLFLTISSLILSIIIYLQDKDPIGSAIFIFAFIGGTILTASIWDGVKSINKFRKGYDQDISQFNNQDRQDNN